MDTLKRVSYVVATLLVWLSGMYLGATLTTVAMADAPRERTRYLKVDGPDTMPYRLVLTKNCRNAEDTMGKLILVDYTPERVIYRCRYPWTY